MSSCVPVVGLRAEGRIVCEDHCACQPPTARSTGVHSMIPRYLVEDGWCCIESLARGRRFSDLGERVADSFELFRRLFIVRECVSRRYEPARDEVSSWALGLGPLRQRHPALR